MYKCTLLCQPFGEGHRLFLIFGSSDWNSASSILIGYIHIHHLYFSMYFFKLTENLATCKTISMKNPLDFYTFEIFYYCIYPNLTVIFSKLIGPFKSIQLFSIQLSLKTSRGFRLLHSTNIECLPREALCPCCGPTLDETWS